MFKKFRKDEDGVVTVDWVVLCGAVVVLAVGVVTALDLALDGAIQKVGESITAEIDTIGQDTNNSGGQQSTSP